MSKHRGTIVANDFGSFEWTHEHEDALRLIEECANILQLTVGEFAESMSFAERECPACKAKRQH